MLSSNERDKRTDRDQLKPRIPRLKAPLLFSLGPEEGGVSSGAIWPLQPDRPFSGSSEGF